MGVEDPVWVHIGQLDILPDMTWCSRHLGPVLVTENLMARGSLEYSRCLMLRWAALLLVSWLAL